MKLCLAVVYFPVERVFQGMVAVMVVVVEIGEEGVREMVSGQWLGFGWLVGWTVSMAGWMAYGCLLVVPHAFGLQLIRGFRVGGTAWRAQEGLWEEVLSMMNCECCGPGDFIFMGSFGRVPSLFFLALLCVGTVLVFTLLDL